MANAKNAKNAKDFLVSTADFSLFYNDVLVCTGNTNLNASIEVTMQEQNVNAGKGNKLLYSYKYGRELAVTLEAADWNISYIATQVGTKITEGFSDAYEMAKCITIVDGVCILPSVPIGDVAVELADGTIVTVKAEGTTIDLTKFGVVKGTVKVTYQYKRIAKSIVIDAESSPDVYKLVLVADKHNNKIGKVGSVQIVIPSYQPSGNFTINFTPDGVTSVNIDGKALAVEGDTCEDGSGVYAYIYDFEEETTTFHITELAATPATIELTTAGATQEISVIGLKGVMYNPIELENTECTFVSDNPEIATVDESGVVTAVAAGSTKITVAYNGVEDEVDVQVTTE